MHRIKPSFNRNLQLVMKLENFHIIEVSHIWHRNKDKVKIKSPRFRETIYIEYNVASDETQEPVQEAVKFLTAKGFKFIGKAEGKDCFLLISSTFKPIK